MAGIRNPSWELPSCWSEYRLVGRYSGQVHLQSKKAEMRRWTHPSHLPLFI
jgi:hypothetical protein